LGREPKVGDQVERFTNTHFAVPRLGLSKILFSLLRNLRNVGSRAYLLSIEARSKQDFFSGNFNFKVGD
jgi:hypothetical protein